MAANYCAKECQSTTADGSCEWQRRPRPAAPVLAEVEARHRAVVQQRRRQPRRALVPEPALGQREGGQRWVRLQRRRCAPRAPASAPPRPATPRARASRRGHAMMLRLT